MSMDDPTQPTESMLSSEARRDLIIDELRPAAFAGKGLAQAMAEYTVRWQEHKDINVTTSISGERPLPLEVEQVLYRVLQEALSNIARHSEADSVTLALDMSAEKVTMLIEDNGCGFEPAAITPNSLGLAGMKSRLAEVDGTLKVVSTVSAGTTIIAEVILKS